MKLQALLVLTLSLAAGVAAPAVNAVGDSPKPNIIFILADDMDHLIDVMPTLLDAIGAANPAAGDGESFLPLIRNESWNRNGPMFFQYADHRAIRTGSWTLAEVDGNGWELFDAREDLLECRDLSKSNPRLVSQLETEWLSWWKHHSGKNRYQPDSTKGSPHYRPQGDRGSGEPYVPASMP